MPVKLVSASLMIAFLLHGFLIAFGFAQANLNSVNALLTALDFSDDNIGSGAIKF